MIKGTLTISVNQDHMQQNAVSDQGLQYTVCIKYMDISINMMIIKTK